MDEDEDIDYTTPRNESEVYRKKSIEDYGFDVIKFCFTEFYILQHVSEVIRDMNHFIRTGHHLIHRHRKRKKFYDEVEL